MQTPTQANKGKVDYIMQKKLIINHLESLLAIAAGKGYKLRGYATDTHTADSIRQSVQYHIERLDELQCPFIVQNRILSYINNIHHPNKWEELFKRSWRSIATEALTE